MNPKDDGGPAFPRPAFEVQSEILCDTLLSKGSAGMSLRDWFAGQALAGILTRLDHHVYANQGKDTEEFNPTIAAEDAYELADAMLAERSKK